ncbi:MAG: site-2 protease family protein [Candidatus Woesearchaeota archaeon]
MVISETTIAIIFFILLGIFLYRNKENLNIQKILFPFLYMILYRTKWGIKSMDSGAKKHPKLVKWISYSGVYICFFGMIITVVYLLYMLFKIFQQGSTVASVAIAQPFVETQIGSPFFYIPFSYFVIVIFIIATVHEFSHGIVARRFGVKVKSSGFAFFSVLIPILPAAFVEPDEKQIQKIKPMKQLAIYAAGPLSNLILAALFYVILLISQVGLANVTQTNIYVADFIQDSDQVLPAELSGIEIGEYIKQIDETEITNINVFTNFMATTKPGQNITILTEENSYQLTLVEYPTKDIGYLGIIPGINTEFLPEFQARFGWSISIILWLLGLMFLLFIFNLGVALINLAPIGPLDGGRMILTLLKTKYKEKKALVIWGKISSLMLLVLLANIFLPFILRLFV